MAKRFIDTGLFEDEWFMELSDKGKIFWIYVITKCDHAGVLRLNKKLCELQTGIKSLATVIKELGNRLVTVRQGLVFCPSFLFYQYPKFPQSGVKAQASAIKILIELNLFDEEKQTVKQHLGKGYGYGYEYGTGNIINKGVEKKESDFEAFLLIMNEKLKKNFQGCKKSRPQFRARIKEGYNLESFKMAIDNILLDPFHIDSNYKHVTPEFLTRADKLEKFINLEIKEKGAGRYDVGEQDYTKNEGFEVM